ncbi:hypothetical protein AsAng_0035560 [Aureispira anguillae]|uniref:Uncharacterized protein n=1 Tax=Aureispira anguillae TaxID=2864201 RepID=A0A916DTV9_9BACT|nr:hypothetical protein AsAng_0035560 [Aureispira anguillae]
MRALSKNQKYKKAFGNGMPPSFFCGVMEINDPIYYLYNKHYVSKFIKGIKNDR